MNVNQCRIWLLAAFALVFVFMSSQAGAQATQDGPSFQDTAKYITTFLSSHGCTNWRSGKSSVEDCVSIVNAESCVIEFGKKRTIDNDDGSESAHGHDPAFTFKVDLRGLDPSNIKTGPEMDNRSFGIEDWGFAVIARSQGGSVALTLAIDSADSATHLINALSHAITLCGGTKAVF